MDADLLTNLSLESDGSDHENVDRNLSVGEDEGCNLDKNNQEHPYVDFKKRNPVRVLLNGNDSLHHLHLELHQISPKHEMGGVHSNIWDGGLGLVRYLSDVYGNEWKHVTVCDLGAGTGVVGLGTAVASAARAVVAMTDLPRAMPLLSENIKLNQKHWIRGEDSAIPKCSVLEWGKPVSKEWLRALIEQGTLATPKEERTFVITGADVVYRRSLFEPLLATLCELSTRVRELANKKYTKMECLLACQSIRSHLTEFWESARKNGFAVERIAIVELDSDKKFHLDRARVQLLDSQHQQLPPVTQTTRREGIIWIVRVRKMPYTFTI